MRTLSVAAAAICVAIAVPAQAQLKVPDCAALANWLAGVNLGEREQLNQFMTYSFAKAVLTPDFSKLYGKAARAFTAADVAAASAGADTCEKDAVKAKDRQASRQFAGLERELSKNLGPVLVMIQKGGEKLDAALDGFDKVPPGIDGLRAAAALRHYAKSGNFREAQRILSGISVREIDAAARAVVDAVRDLPEEEARAKIAPRIEARFGPARDAALKEAGAALAALPDTIEGLRQLDRSAHKQKDDLSRALPPEDLKSIDEAVAAKRGAIEEKLFVDAKAKIDTMPTSFSTLVMLNQSGARPVAAGLPPPRVQALEAHVNARKKVLAEAVAVEAVKSVGEIPADADGLSQLAVFQRNFRTGATPHVGAIQSQKVEEAIAERARVIAKAVYPDFQKAVRAVPETRPGLANLAQIEQERVGVLRPLSASEGDRFAEVLQKRRAAILETIEKDEKRLAGRSLQGQKFADANGVVRIEFRDRKRAYLFNPGGGTVEANWEQDGQRIVLRQPTVNTVMERQGATLVGDGTTLWPVLKE